MSSDNQRFYPITKAPSPGEMFKLVEALVPTRMSIEVAKAYNLAAPPYLLTYRGRNTGAIVRTMFAA